MRKRPSIGSDENLPRTSKISGGDKLIMCISTMKLTSNLKFMVIKPSYISFGCIVSGYQESFQCRANPTLASRKDALPQHSHPGVTISPMVSKLLLNQNLKCSCKNFNYCLKACLRHLEPANMGLVEHMVQDAPYVA